MKKIIFFAVAVFLISFSCFVYALDSTVCPLQYHLGCQIKGIETAQMTSPLDGSTQVTLLQLFQALSAKITTKVNEAYGNVIGTKPVTSDDVQKVMDDLSKAEKELAELENEAMNCAG